MKMMFQNGDQIKLKQDLFVLSDEIKNASNLLSKEEVDEYISLYIAEGTVLTYDEDDQTFYTEDYRNININPQFESHAELYKKYEFI